MRVIRKIHAAIENHYQQGILMNNKPSLKKLPLVIAIGLASSSAWAEKQDLANNTTEVWATQVSSTSTFLGDDDIELKQADHLSDLLRSLPGVEVGGTHSVNQKITIRGLDDTDLDITIDGVSQNAYMYHHAGNILINPDILKAADIQVGANSVLTGALGGGVAFETKDAKDLLAPGDHFGGRIQGHVASNKYAGYSLTSYGRVGSNIDLLAYIYQVDRDNPEDGKGRENLGSDGEITNGLFKAGFDIDNSNRLEFSYDQYNDEGDYPYRPDMGVATNVAITGDKLYPTTYDRKTFRVGYELDKGDDLFLSASVYHNDLELERKENADEYQIKAGTTINTGAKLLAESLLDMAGYSHNLRYGAEINKQETEMKKDGADKGGEDATSIALYLEDEIAITDSFRFIPGIRHNHYDLNATARDNTYSKTTWSVATEVDVTDELTFHLSNTTLFQGPNLEEAFYADSVNEVNTNLKPETGTNTEIGLRYKTNHLAGLDQLKVGFTAFNSDIEDRIAWQRANNTWVNVDQVTLRGFEASVKADKGDLGVLLAYSKSNSEEEATGMPFADEAGDSISLTVDYTLPALNLELEWDSQVVLKEENYDKSGYDVHSISARWTPDTVKGLAITAGIENLFDTYYVSHVSRIGESNHPSFGQLLLDDAEPGRNFKLTAAYSF